MSLFRTPLQISVAKKGVEEAGVVVEWGGSSAGAGVAVPRDWRSRAAVKPSGKSTDPLFRCLVGGPVGFNALTESIWRKTEALRH